MKIRHLSIQNFRGIKKLDWNITQDMVCLIGPGDSTKSTILQAIDWALWANWNLSTTDMDFYQLDTSSPIEITVTVTDLPNDLIREDEFGLSLSFWNPEDGVHDVEKPGDDKALVVRLMIGGDLEPQWVIQPRQDAQHAQVRRISSNDRAKLGVSQIGTYVDRDLSWGRRSALSRMTSRDDVGQVPAILADATRRVLASLENVDFAGLASAVQEVKSAAEDLGVHPDGELKPGVDAARLNVSVGAVTLLDGGVPLNARGAGSRRLVAMAIHRAAVTEGSIILVDEIENSLEPYRLRHLIRALRPDKDESGQAIFTTHSPVALVECKTHELCVVRSQGGQTTVKPINVSLARIVRKIPEAFLAHSVIVCEGKTEWGICKAVDRYWQKQAGKPPLAAVGVEPIASPSAGGSEAPKYAIALRELGYRVAYFGDSDVPLSPSREAMTNAGIEVVLWDDNFEIERRLCADLPFVGVLALVDLAIELEKADQRDADIVWNRLHTQIKEKGLLSGNTLAQDVRQLARQIGDPAVRECIGEAADKGKWFKRWDKGEALGDLLTAHLDSMRNTDTYRKLDLLEAWSHG